MTITDEMLYEAASQAAERFLDTLPDRADCAHTFSPAFEQKMAPLLEPSRRRRPRRALLAAAAAVICALTVGLGVGANNMSDCQLYWSQADGVLQYAVRLEHETSRSFCPVELTYVPQGFALERSGMNGEREYCVAYRSGEDGFFQVRQRAGDEYTGMFSGDYQGSEVEINGRLGMLAEKADGGERMLLWTDGPYILTIYADGVSKEELLCIAEKITW